MHEAVKWRLLPSVVGRDTHPEMATGKGLHSLGFRYRLHDKMVSGKATSPACIAAAIAGDQTNIFAADDFQKAFEIMASGQSGKVILNWEEETA